MMKSKKILRLYTLKNISTMEHPDKVYASLLDGDSNDPKERSSKVIVPSVTYTEVNRQLLSEQSYMWNRPKACVPLWSARLVYERGGQSTILDFCFSCKQMRVSNGGKSDFDPISPKLLTTFKTLFPDDPVLKEAINN